MKSKYARKSTNADPRSSPRVPQTRICGCVLNTVCPHTMVSCPLGHLFDAKYYGNYCPKCKFSHLVVTNDWGKMYKRSRYSKKSERIN